MTYESEIKQSLQNRLDRAIKQIEEKDADIEVLQVENERHQEDLENAIETIKDKNKEITRLTGKLENALYKKREYLEKWEKLNEKILELLERGRLNK